MNVLVTGANGFIGRGLVEALAARGDRVFGIYSHAQAESGEGFICDLSNDASVSNGLPQLAETRWDSVVHLASVLCNDSTDDMQVFQTNLDITRNLIRICRDQKPRQLVHASSIAVYPNESGTFSEASAVRPSANAEGLYGLSKVCAENLFDHQLRDAGTEILHLRLAQIWGAGMRSDRIMSVMRDELAQTGKITVFGKGERVSNFIHIDKLVSVFCKLIGPASVSGIFNLGDELLSYRELAERVAAERGLDRDVIASVERGSRAKFQLDTSKLDALLATLS